MALRKVDLGFTPVIRVGKVGIITKLPFPSYKREASIDDQLSLSGASWSFRNRNSIVLEAPFEFEHGTTVDELFARTDDGRVRFRVLRVQDGNLLKPFIAPDPYTDDHLVVLSLDDLMTLYLSV